MKRECTKSIHKIVNLHIFLHSKLAPAPERNAFVQLCQR